MKSLLLSVLIALTTFTAQARFQVAEIQTFPGYIEVTYDQEVNPGATDLLFVIDDSGSMYSHQQSLAKFAEQFVNSFINNPALDLQVGVITTTFMQPHRGNLVKAGTHTFVNRQTPDAAAVLKQLILVGTYGAGDEKPFASLVEAVSVAKREGPNAGFFRPGAALKVVLFTDAEDQSQETPDIALERLHFVAPVVSVDAFIANKANSCMMDDPNTEPTRILEIVRLAAGQSFPICQNDLGPSLTSILKPVNGGGPIEIPLPSLADPSSIVVTYGSQVILGGAVRSGWTLDEDRNVILIGSRVIWTTQPEGTRLKVRYVPQDWR
ncbi:MAG: VWA domain-containing protein [Bdellovibrionaceae bacterium]|nr:VWA domain-containing protein [Pseudobdellovibrionaceae bacterium]